MKKPKILPLTGSVVLTSVLGYALFLIIDGLLSRPAPADVAIVFGSMVEKTGFPSPRLQARLRTALELYRSKLVSAIIVSGGHGKEGFDESEVMKTFLIKEGVRANDIYADDRGDNTKLTCQNSLQLMKAHHWQSADIVTQYFHVTRAKFACRKTGIRVAGSAAPKFFEIRDIYSLFREMAALPVYWLK